MFHYNESSVRPFLSEFLTFISVKITGNPMRRLSERYSRRSDRTFPEFFHKIRRFVEWCKLFYASGFTKINKPAWKRDVIGVVLQPCAYEDSVRCTARNN